MEQKKTSITQKLTQFEAEADKKKQEILSCLNPSQTALLCGFDLRSTCSASERNEFRRHTRRTLYDLLDMGISNILIEHSLLFGYYALDELVRQHQKYGFTLMGILQKPEKYSWLHTRSSKLSLVRSLRSVRNLVQCDEILGTFSDNEWLGLLHDHIALMISEKPPYYRNRSALTTAQFNQWGPTFGDKEAAELIQMLNSEEFGV